MTGERGEEHDCQMAIAGFLESYVFGPSGCWTMAPLRYAAKFDPFLSLDCAPTPSTLAQSKERKGSNFASWQPWYDDGCHIESSFSRPHIALHCVVVMCLLPLHIATNGGEIRAEEASAVAGGGSCGMSTVHFTSSPK